MSQHLSVHAATVQAPCSAHTWQTAAPWLFRQQQTVQGMFCHQRMERVLPGILGAAPKGKALHSLPRDRPLTAQLQEPEHKHPWHNVSGRAQLCLQGLIAAPASTLQGPEPAAAAGSGDGVAGSPQLWSWQGWGRSPCFLIPQPCSDLLGKQTPAALCASNLFSAHPVGCALLFVSRAPEREGKLSPGKEPAARALWHTC